MPLGLVFLLFDVGLGDAGKYISMEEFALHSLAHLHVLLLLYYFWFYDINHATCKPCYLMRRKPEHSVNPAPSNPSNSPNNHAEAKPTDHSQNPSMND